MPRENSKLPDREAAICLRLSDARIVLGLDQAVFGAPAELSRDRIASYENLRAPLRYEAAERLCQSWGICQRFLVLGKPPLFHYVKLPAELVRRVRPRALLSEAYDSGMGACIEAALMEEAVSRECSIAELDGFQMPSADVIAKTMVREDSLATLNALLPILTSAVRRGYESLPANLRWKFYREVLGAVTAFLEKHRNRRK